jgi:hypothetical protein
MKKTEENNKRNAVDGEWEMKLYLTDDDAKKRRK